MNYSILIAIGLSLGIGVTVMVLLPLLKKKGVKVDEVLNKVDTTLVGVGAVVNVADKLLPNNPIVSTLSTIEKYAHIGVHEAEQLCIASQLNKDDRNKSAKETIYTVLKIMNIEVTPDIERVINSTIEAEVLTLGHKAPDETQRQAEKDKLIAENQRLQAENQNLTNVVNNIKSMVPVQ